MPSTMRQPDDRVELVDVARRGERAVEGGAAAGSANQPWSAPVCPMPTRNSPSSEAEDQEQPVRVAPVHQPERARA